MLGIHFFMKISKNVASEDKIACLFVKLASGMEKEAEKTAQGLPKSRPKHPKGSQRARSGSWPLSKLGTTHCHGALGRVGRGHPPWA